MKYLIVSVLFLCGCSPVAVMTPDQYKKERKAMDKSKKMLDRMSSGSDKAIRDYRMP